MVESILTLDVVNAITGAKHPDIFNVLGMFEHPSEKGLIVRVFLPDALGVEVIDDKTGRKVATLNLVNNVGLFEGKLGRRRKIFNYRLRVAYADATLEIDDPYRFASLLNDSDVYLFAQGTHEQVYDWMGAHVRQVNNVTGMSFVLWAPGAMRVSVVADFNQWDGRKHMMRKHPGSGIWDIFIPGVGENQQYKYEILGRNGQVLPLKADPYAFAMQHPPQTASITVSDELYRWQDNDWMTKRTSSEQHYHGPVSIYEVHLASWRRAGTDYLSYRVLAEQLIPYVVEMGFSHIQVMPVSEYPFDGSWGYQPVGLFAPTSRFGSPQDFKYFVDCCHQQGIGVLLDWVPGHFPTDQHGIGQFDGACLYEHQDARKGFHPDWKTLIYNYGRNEVQSYLISNALYWLSEFHVDGLRVDAVTSMLHLDYSRAEGEWLPNIHGGCENLEAIELLQQVNSRAYFNNPGTMMVAEESTAWPGVSHPVDEGGLGFGFKWNMGWMHDTLQYMSRDPIHRQHHHNEMTFGIDYGFSENFVLPLSHDEVVHGKGSLLSRMPGDEWQKFANLRAYYGFMWTHPGKKLLFMGGEFGQIEQWDHDKSLDWHLLETDNHAGVQRLVKDLNHVYRTLPALHELDCDSNGFEWLVSKNQQQSIFIYLRKGHADTAPVLVVSNMTPSTYTNYQIGVPLAGFYQECLNTDSQHYGGSNIGNAGGLQSSCQTCDGQPFSLVMTIAPLSTMIFQWQASA